MTTNVHETTQETTTVNGINVSALKQAIADIEANQKVEATIAERKRSRGDLEAKVQAILGGSSEPSE